MRLLLLFVALTLSLTFAFGSISWSVWKNQHQREYKTLWEEEFRHRNWLDNNRMIHKHQKQHPNATYELGLNHLSDLSHREFKNRMGFNPNPIPTNVCEQITKVNHPHPLPSSVDWRDKGVVSSVKDQGQCGSCWAFSAVATMESAWAITFGSKNLYNLSEQQLLDCSWSEGDHGCGGGLMDWAFNYTIVNHGICSNQSYPYVAKNETCQLCKPVVAISSCHDLQTGNATDNEKTMLMAVAKAPISVGVYAGNNLWFQYKGGILDDPDCLPGYVDHGVTIVGYGTENEIDYWTVKNSWGQTWGENGYIRIVRGKNMCRIGEYATSVSIKSNADHSIDFI